MPVPRERELRRGEVDAIYDEAVRKRNAAVQLSALLVWSLLNLERAMSEIERDTVRWPVEGPSG